MEYKVIENNVVVCKTKKGVLFLVDFDKLNLIKQYSWSFNNGYLVAYDKVQKRNIYLHQLLTNTHINRDKTKVVDHVNHNKLDNRLKNLRVVTYKENSRNCTISKKNKAACTGVTFNKTRKRWQAIITINYKNKMLGMFKSKEDAITARKQAEQIYWNK